MNGSASVTTSLTSNRQVDRSAGGICRLLIALVAASSVALLGLGACTVVPGGVPGLIQGRLYAVSGIDPEGWPVEAAEVTATRIGGSGQTYSTTVTADGVFVLSLPPGQYELNATMISPNQGDVATPEEVTVKSNGIVKVTLYFNYP